MSVFKRACVAAAAACVWTAVPAAELITVGGGAYHFERDLDLNEFNYGLGYERDINEEWSWSAGVYKNSIRRATFYLLGNYYPYELGAGFRVGLTGGLVTGYHKSPVVPLLAPTIEWRGKWVAAQAYVVPTVKPYVDGAVIFQLKFIIKD
ncbi:MAG: hypothetical protein QM639_03020 [Rhodocyclaceae bacterium]